MSLKDYTTTQIYMGYGRTRKLSFDSAVRSHERYCRDSGLGIWMVVGVSYLRMGVAWMCTLTILTDK